MVFRIPQRTVLSWVSPVVAAASCFVAVTYAESVRAQSDAHLDAITEKAMALPNRPPRYAEHIKFGVRGTIFSNIAVSPSDPDTLYVSTFEGFVFGSQDRGLSWSEGRLIVRRSKFFGALRPDPSPNGVNFKMTDVLKSAPLYGFAGHSLNGFLRFRPDKEVVTSNPSITRQFGCAAPQLSPNVHPLAHCPPYDPHANYTGAIVLTSFGSPAWLGLKDEGGGGGGGGDMARLGVGLNVAAQRLAALLLKKHKKVPSMNLKLMLNVKGVEPTYVGHLAVHPRHPTTALAATRMGLFRTDDGGTSWGIVFPGTNNSERRGYFVAYQPGHDEVVFLGTGQGLRISYDGGQNFTVIKGTQLSSVSCHWIEFFKGNSDIMYAGTNIGVFRSDDGGLTWRWVFFETLSTMNDITGIAIHPQDPDRVMLSTGDGLFISENGGKSWRRTADFLIAQRTSRIAGDPVNGDHIVTTNYREVWETWDRGKTWNIIYINDSDWAVRALVFDPIDPSLLWILTSNEIIRFSNKKPVQVSAEDTRRLRRRIATEPSLNESVVAAQKAALVYLGDRSQYRKRANWAGLLPRVSMGAGYFTVAGQSFVSAPQEPNIPSPYGERGGRYHDPYAGIVLNWDPRALLFQQDSMPFGRVFNDGNRLYHNFKFEVQRLYEERQRILIRLYTAPPAELRAVLMLQLRLEEMTAYLNTLTAGLWQKELDWVQHLDLLGQRGERNDDDE